MEDKFEIEANNSPIPISRSLVEQIIKEKTEDLKENVKRQKISGSEGWEIVKKKMITPVSQAIINKFLYILLSPLKNTTMTVVGAGPIGLILTSQLLGNGANVILYEIRKDFTRQQIIKLWPAFWRDNVPLPVKKKLAEKQMVCFYYPENANDVNKNKWVCQDIKTIVPETDAEQEAFNKLAKSKLGEPGFIEIVIHLGEFQKCLLEYLQTLNPNETNGKFEYRLGAYNYDTLKADPSSHVFICKGSGSNPSTLVNTVTDKTNPESPRTVKQICDLSTLNMSRDENKRYMDDVYINLFKDYAKSDIICPYINARIGNTIIITFDVDQGVDYDKMDLQTIDIVRGSREVVEFHIEGGKAYLSVALSDTTYEHILSVFKTIKDKDQQIKEFEKTEEGKVFKYVFDKMNYKNPIITSIGVIPIVLSSAKKVKFEMDRRKVYICGDSALSTYFFTGTGVNYGLVCMNYMLADIICEIVSPDTYAGLSKIYKDNLIDIRSNIDATIKNREKILLYEQIYDDIRKNLWIEVIPKKVFDIDNAIEVCKKTQNIEVCLMKCAGNEEVSKQADLSCYVKNTEKISKIKDQLKTHINNTTTEMKNVLKNQKIENYL